MNIALTLLALTCVIAAYFIGWGHGYETKQALKRRWTKPGVVPLPRSSCRCGYMDLGPASQRPGIPS